MKHRAEKTHLTDAQLDAFSRGKPEKSLALEVAEHAAVCPCCAAALVEALETATMPTEPPRGFTESVILRLTADQNRRREFRLYCARVAACVVATIGLMAGGIFYGAKIGAVAKPPSISSGMREPEPLTVPEPKPISASEQRENVLEKAGDFLNQLLQSIFNPEETSNDQTEK